MSETAAPSTPKRPRRVLPAQRTLEYLRKHGMTAQVVERLIRPPTIPGRFTRPPFYQDLFGFIDIVALQPTFYGVLGVQTTTVANQASRLTKIADEPRAQLWLEHANRIWVVGWSKKGKRGERKLWTPTVTEVTLENLATWATPPAPF